jgi:hypothetical protein
MIAAMLLVIALGPAFGTFGREKRPPPQPYTELVVLPGKPPIMDKELIGAWELVYRLDDAQLEDGRAELSVHLFLHLHEDGSYELNYSARWGGIAGYGARTLTVSEEGSFSRSGEVLLLEPARTVRAEIQAQVLVSQAPIPDENHVWIVRRDGKYLHVAGRCATYQIDPICRVTPTIWYSMRSELGRRWLQRGAP